MSDESVVPGDRRSPAPTTIPSAAASCGGVDDVRSHRHHAARRSHVDWCRGDPRRSRRIDAEHVTLTRLFVAVAVAQIGVGLVALVKGGRLAAVVTALVNVGAVAAWGATRLWGISWIDGLEVAEDPQFTDAACATLGAIAVVAALVALVRGRTRVSTVRLGVPAFAVGVVTLAAMLVGTNHSHSHAEEAAVASGAGAPVAAADDGHAHSHAEEPSDEATAAAAAPVDRPWAYDPAQPVDLSGVEGVTPEQRLRATALVQNTLRDLPAFADVESLDALGYRSIGDSRTGYEHFINYSLINDDVILDPTQPESLVYRVEPDGSRTLVSAMFIVGQRAIDDPELVDYGGRLMQWHVHENLCWRGGEDGPQVDGVTDAEGNCPEGTVRAGGDNPMVHVWIAPHECGPFAALEGHGAGQAAAADGHAPTSARTTMDTATQAKLRPPPNHPPTVRRQPPQRRPSPSIHSSRSICRARPG